MAWGTEIWVPMENYLTLFRLCAVGGIDIIMDATTRKNSL
jgi:hypothetical protein